jgi:hypothetical protein
MNTFAPTYRLISTRPVVDLAAYRAAKLMASGLTVPDPSLRFPYRKKGQRFWVMESRTAQAFPGAN